jgi:serpin B
MPPITSVKNMRIVLALMLSSLPLSALLLSGVILAACTSAKPAFLVQADAPRQNPLVAQEDLNELVDGNNAFALELYQSVKDREENIFYSPYSLSKALVMAYAGAHGQTADQMAKALHFSLPPERLHPAFNALDLDLSSRSQPASPVIKTVEAPEAAFELNIANAVWGQQGAPFRAEYVDFLAQNYGAGLRLVDFKGDSEAAVQEINRWVSKETNDRIPQIAGALDPKTVLVLANAIYFNALWASPFDETLTQPEPFYLLDGREETTPLMHLTKKFRYSEGDGYQVVGLPYAHPDFSMLVLLPQEGRFREIEQQISAEWLQEIERGFDRREVILSMPKFSFEATLPDLKDTLSKMGMPDAFSSSADFSSIAEQFPLKISEVLHKAFIEVSEQRTEAAAASIVEIMPVSADYTPPPPVEMRIDRPFIFFIRDDHTGALLFAGRVLNPVQSEIR